MKLKVKILASQYHENTSRKGTRGRNFDEYLDLPINFIAVFELHLVGGVILGEHPHIVIFVGLTNTFLLLKKIFFHRTRMFVVIVKNMTRVLKDSKTYVIL